jgi:hypothetical protein
MKILRAFWGMAALLAILLSACTTSGPTNTPGSTPPAAGPTQAPLQTEQQGLNSGCIQAAIVPTTAVATINPAYPTPPQMNPSYPAPTQSVNNQPNNSYPAPPASPTPRKGTNVMLVPFRINKPVLAGATTVTGTGPADIPVTLANLSLMGEILGETTVQPDCSFTIQLNKPIENNTWIGITHSDLKGTKWIPQDFQNPGFRSDGAQQVPQVGFFYDTTTVVAGK